METPWGRQGLDWETWFTNGSDKRLETRMKLTETMVWDKLPWFQGGSAYRLLAAVKQVIKDEPLRMDMGCTVRSPMERYNNRGQLYTEPAGECGTIGCIAGWMHILTAPTPDAVWRQDPIHQALLLLPHGVREDAARLFYGRTGYPFPIEKEGTRKYTEKVVANIDRFMAAHYMALQAHPVVVKPRVGWKPFEQWGGRKAWMKKYKATPKKGTDHLGVRRG